MELIMEQFPIVIQSLNVGFLQTLKLFFVTLLGALPLGLIIAFGSMSHFRPYCMGSQRNAADDPDADYLLFPGTGIE